MDNQLIMVAIGVILIWFVVFLLNRKNEEISELKDRVSNLQLEVSKNKSAVMLSNPLLKFNVDEFNLNIYRTMLTYIDLHIFLDISLHSPDATEELYARVLVSTQTYYMGMYKIIEEYYGEDYIQNIVYSKFHILLIDGHISKRINVLKNTKTDYSFDTLETTVLDGNKE